MNLLESVVNVEVTYELDGEAIVKLIPDMMEELEDSDMISEAQVERFNELAQEVMDGAVLGDGDSAFMYGLYLILKS